MTSLANSATPRRPLAHRLLDETRQWPVTLKIGSAILALIVLAGIFAPWLTPYDPYYQDLVNALQPPSWKIGRAHV